MTKTRKLNKVIGMLLDVVEQEQDLTDAVKLRILESTLKLLKLRKELKP